MTLEQRIRKVALARVEHLRIHSDATLKTLSNQKTKLYKLCGGYTDRYLQSWDEVIKLSEQTITNG